MPTQTPVNEPVKSPVNAPTDGGKPMNKVTIYFFAILSMIMMCSVSLDANAWPFSGVQPMPGVYTGNISGATVKPTGSSVTDTIADWLAALPGENVTRPVDREITGTTDTILSTDAGKVLLCKNIAGCAFTLPAASTSGFLQGYGLEVDNLSAGNATIAPSSGLINGIKTLTIRQHEGCAFRSNSTNYLADQAACPALAYNPTFETGTMTTLDSRLTVSNATTGRCSYVDASGIIQYTATGACGGRVDYDPTTLAYKGVTVEPATANQYGRLSTYSSLTDVTATYSYATGPDGLTSAAAITPNTSSTIHYFIIADIATFQTTKTQIVSIFAKSNGYNYFQLASNSAIGTATWANVNLSNCTVGNKGAAALSSGAIQYPNGWCLFYMTYYRSSADMPNQPWYGSPLNTDTASRFPTYAGDGTSGVLVFGANTNVFDGSRSDAKPSSFRPFQGAVRQRDIVTVANPHWLDSTTGTSCITFIPKYAIASQPVIADSASSRSMLYYATSTGAGSTDGTNTVDYAKTFDTAGSESKVCIRYSGVTSNISVDGVAGTQGTFDGSFNFTNMLFLSDQAGATTEGWVKNIIWYDYALTDAEMNVKTTP